MTRAVRLTSDDREFFRFLFVSLSLTQKTFSDRAGVPQGWLSGVLSGKRSGIDPLMLDKMGTAAQVLLEEGRAAGRVDETVANELQRGIGKVFRIRIETSKLIAPAGGAIPSFAANFIERRQEMDIAASLLSGTPFTMSVEGGPKTGKTTFLKWFEEQAAQKGFETAYVDCSDLRLSNSGNLVSDFDAILGYLAEVLIEEWELTNVRMEGMRFINWWLRMKGPLVAGRPQPRLLILDRLTKIGVECAIYLLKLIRIIHNSRATDGVSISFALGIDADIVVINDEVDVRRSWGYSVVNPRLRMRRFSYEQIGEVIGAVTDVQPTAAEVSGVGELSKEFKCQPLFVHIAAEFLGRKHAFAKLVNAVKEYVSDDRKPSADVDIERFYSQLDDIYRRSRDVEEMAPENPNLAMRVKQFADAA